MGMFVSDLQAVLHILGNTNYDNNCVITYGTQTIRGSLSDVVAFSVKNGLHLNDISEEDLYSESNRGFDKDLECNVLFKMLGFKQIINLDLLKNTPYAYIHDLSDPVPKQMYATASLLLDGTTGYHVFDRAQSLKNVVNLLTIGGLAIHTFMIDPLKPHFSSYNPQSLAQFYLKNGFGEFQLYVCNRAHSNTFFKFHGDLNGPIILDSKEKYCLVFACRKLEDVEVSSNIIEHGYSQTARYNEKLKKMSSHINSKKFAVWGTSIHYEKHYRSILRDSDLEKNMWGFIDNDKNKWGEVIDGQVVHAPKDLIGSGVEIVLIASQRKSEIFQQLCEIMYSNVNTLINTYMLYEDNIDIKRLNHALDEYRFSHGLTKSI
ncbi:hypothetical protein [Lacimicrobium alkaliphilum]|uniref:Uncharacterized protein n=1 Tax=Lacimicrobium alkaliphilum TaxID=1526571 RepID=A0A0U2Z9G7_9ALTE|nr:hypothetical protein [Lacimicrobium alkaliphilum]ALS99060.1 hypothetical protein AT746_12830 [Lacimicrobium alkaliphilum]